MNNQPIATRNELAQFNRRAAFKTFVSEPQDDPAPSKAFVAILVIIICVAYVAAWTATKL